jgi:hypothetical protein
LKLRRAVCLETSQLVFEFIAVLGDFDQASLDHRLKVFVFLAEHLFTSFFSLCVVFDLVRDSVQLFTESQIKIFHVLSCLDSLYTFFSFVLFFDLHDSLMQLLHHMLELKHPFIQDSLAFDERMLALALVLDKQFKQFFYWQWDVVPTASLELQDKRMCVFCVYRSVYRGEIFVPIHLGLGYWRVV